MLPALAIALATAAGPSESITVNAEALTGAWTITRPTYIAKRSLFGAIEFGPPAPGFCRVERQEDEFAFHCLGHGEGTVHLEGRNIRFAWGSMLARVAMEGVLQSDNSFSGRIAFKLAGITAVDSNLSSGSKLDLSRPAPDTGNAAQLLRTAISQDNSTGIMGKVQTLILLGHQDRLGSPGKPNAKDYFTVFAVEFDHGERICGVHQRDDGVMDALQCA
jgi:hypothetical protein